MRNTFYLLFILNFSIVYPQVGIGTTDPSALLDVQGDFKVIPYATFGNVDYIQFKKVKYVRDTGLHLIGGRQWLGINNQNDVIYNGPKPCVSDTTKFVIGDLNIIDDKVFNLTKTKDIDLNLFGIIDGKLKSTDILLQANFCLFKDFVCDDKTITRVVVGMIMYVHISDLKKDAKATLSDVSAYVQLGKATATYHLQFFGLTQNVDFKDLPSMGALNVDNYSKILSSWDKIKSSLDRHSEIDPIIIPNVKAVILNIGY